MKKQFSSKWIIFFFGFFLGIIALSTYKYFTDIYEVNKYFQLKNNYSIENIGYLKSGTLLKIDESMSEGFTRYILYLNISDGEKIDIYETKQKDIIIPYWLSIKDTTITH